MLSPADAELVRRDPALPGLALLLDPSLLAETLAAALPEAAIRHLEATDVRYKPGTSCLVSFVLGVGATRHQAYAKAYGPAAPVKLPKRRERAPRTSALGPARVVLDDFAVVLHLFPDDHELPSLHGLADGRVRPRLLERIAPRRPELWHGEVVGLRYKPERRYVGRLRTTAGESAALRLYAKGEFAPARAAARAFSSAGELVAARVLGRSDGLRALLLEWLPGRSLEEILLDPGLDPGALDVVAAALARLHAHDPAALAAPSRLGAESAVAAAADGVGAVLPELAARARELGRLVASRLVTLAFVARTIHGDFTADQVLLTGERAAIVDLDRAVAGHPAADLGSFLARLEYDVLSGALERGRADAVGDELVAAYRRRARSASELPVGLHAAAALLRLAVEPFRRREPGWPDRTEALLERAELLAGRPSLRGRRRRAASASPLGDLLHLTLPEREAERLGLPPGPLSLRRAWPRAPGHLLLEYDAGGQVVAAQWIADPARREHVARATERASAAASVALAETAGKTLLVQARGADRRLGGLAPLVTRAGASLVAHRAERRAVVRLDDAKGVRFAKVVRRERVSSVVEAGRAAERLAGAGFATPALLDVDRSSGVVVWSQLAGPTLYELAASERLVAAGGAAGRALRTLHESAPPRAGGLHPASEDARWLGVWVDRVAAFAPELGRVIGASARRATAALVDGEADPVLLHRDFFDKQVVIGPDGGVGFLDFDTLARGEAALDVANMLAHVELRALQGRMCAVRAAAAAAAFVDGYEPSAEVGRRCGAYTDATRVRLACVYAFRPASASVVTGLLANVGRPPLGLRPLDEDLRFAAPAATR